MNWTDEVYPSDHPRAGEPVDPVEAAKAYLAEHPYHPMKGEIETWLNGTRQLISRLAALCEELSKCIGPIRECHLIPPRGYTEEQYRRWIMNVAKKEDGTPVFPRREGES